MEEVVAGSNSVDATHVLVNHNAGLLSCFLLENLDRPPQHSACCQGVGLVWVLFGLVLSHHPQKKGSQS
jgi:hypothetical protein